MAIRRWVVKYNEENVCHSSSCLQQNYTNQSAVQSVSRFSGMRNSKPATHSLYAPASIVLLTNDTGHEIKARCLHNNQFGGALCIHTLTHKCMPHHLLTDLLTSTLHAFEIGSARVIIIRKEIAIFWFIYLKNLEI